MAAAAKVRGTWDPVAVYGAAGRLSDADLVRWILEREARVFALGVDQALRPRASREKPDPAQAAVKQVLADRLAEIAARADCFASPVPIAQDRAAA